MSVSKAYSLHLHRQEEGMKKLRLKIYDLAENKRKRFSTFLKPNVPTTIFKWNITTYLFQEIKERERGKRLVIFWDILTL